MRSRRFVADLHIHSKHSMACSRDCDLENLAWWAARKGIAVVGTGDVCHPAWATEIREKLSPAEPGLFRLRPDLERDVLRRLPASCRTPVRFMLSVEISTIYKRADRTRKVHHLLYLPDLAAAAELTRRLARVGNLASDGRPILGLDSRDLLETTLESGEGSYLVPAHVWTPWFAALGSKSGFDSIGDCYADLADHVFALETGLSSDPAMNWRVSSLDRYRLVSNSDAHSPPALGREATVFETEIDYWAIRRALETGDGFAGTVEFFPEEGKYHLDGHRRCEVRLDPATTREHAGACPRCGSPLTVGVLHRVEVLADRPDGVRPEGAAPYQCVVQLPQIIGEIRGVGPRTKTVEAEVNGLVGRLGPELAILRDVPLDDIDQAGSALVAEAIGRLRRGDVVREGGYDGEYGVIRIFDPKELADAAATPGLFALPAPASAAKDSVVDRVVETPVSMPKPKPAAAAELVPVPRAEAVAPASLLDALDPDQRAAAEIVDGPVVVVAGPGTGKTRMLTHRIAHLVTRHGVRAEECLAITFTRRAAEEMRERLAVLLPVAADRVLVATFHALGLRILREHAERYRLTPGFRIADEAERLTLVRAAVGAGVEGPVPRALLAEISRLTRAGTAPSDVDGDVAGVLARYRAGKRARNMVDLDDLLAVPVGLLAGDPDLAERYRRRWRWVSVDEYQDVDETQYRLLSLLTPADGNLCAVGDPDQAIYGFRGADVGFFLRFREDFPSAREVRLTRNYRSSPVILRAALQAIAPSTLVTDRVLAPAAETPDPNAAERIVLHTASDERAEAGFVVGAVERLLGGSSFHAFDSGRVVDGHHPAQSFADVAVLYRTDAQSWALVEAFDAAGIPYQKRSHHHLTDQPGVRAMLAALREGAASARTDPRPMVARLRAAAQVAIDAAGGLDLAPPDAEDQPASGDQPYTVDDVRTAVELLTPVADRCGADLDRFLAELAVGAEVDFWDPRADRVSLLTLHAAKGLEFPVVFVVGCEDDLLPLRWAVPDGSAPGSLRSSLRCDAHSPVALAETDRAGDTAEERRLFFVGVTRARTHLLLTTARRRTWRGATQDTSPSRFLADVDPTLLDRSTGQARRKSVQLRLL